ncbi:hypothetical protein ACFLYO_04955 [Chloroflexota bacterium]
MRKKTVGRLLVLVGIVLVAACGVVPGLDPLNPPQSNVPSAASYLPNFTGYTRIEANSIQEYIASLGEAGAALTGQFEAVAVIEMVDRVSSCYQNLGVVAAAGYSKVALPVVAGVVAVSNRDRLLDPQTFLACVGLAQQPQSFMADGQGGGGLQPCSYSYSVEIAGDTYDFLYAGTDLEICQAFCRSLPSCTGH